MSRYYEAETEEPWKIINDLKNNKVIDIIFVKEEDHQICVKDKEENHLWLWVDEEPSRTLC